MAYATARCFGKETDHLLVAMAQKAEYLKVRFEDILYCSVVYIFILV